jgi:plasmid stabilization system protein ParE
MNYKVIWSNDAVEERIDIIEFLLDNATEGVAELVDDKFKNYATLLSDNPFLGRNWEGAARRITVADTSYLMFYDVDEENKKIRIFKISHGSRRR